MRNSTFAETKIRKRSMFILLAVLIGWMILIFRLFQIQILSYDQYKANVLSNVQKTSTSKATRGEIYDSQMNKLAANYTVYRVFISPHDIEEDQETSIAAGLSEILGVDYYTILQKAQKKYRYDETILKKASDEQAEAVQKFKKDNGYKTQIYLEAMQARYYPYGSMAAHVIGVLGTDGGLTGLEYMYNGYLTGENGKMTIAKDATGAPIYSSYDSFIDASNGANLVTTIDRRIQGALETQLKAAYENATPLNRVTGIVMDCNSGAVLAMATYPTFDLNSPFELDEASQLVLSESGIDPSDEAYVQKQTDLLYTLWSNKAVTEPYEPGSTFKVITAASALEAGVVTFDDEFTCSGRFRNASCHVKRGHGTHPFRYGLQQSCNPTLMQVGELLGTSLFMKYFEQFGYKEKTGIDLPGEARSIYHATSNFFLDELDSYAFGQAFKVTPIRHITSIAAVANGGYLLQPYIVDRIVDDDGKILFQHLTEPLRQVVSSGVCDQISEVLEEGVSGNGQAKNAYVAGYKISAKTGTSEQLDSFVRDENGNLVFDDNGKLISTGYVVGSTIAFAPSDDPQVIALIVVDTPMSDKKFGGYVAAPYIAKLMDEILPYIGIDRVYSETTLKNMQFRMWGFTGDTHWSTSGAKSLVNRYGVECIVVGSGNKVMYQVPRKGEIIMKSDGVVYLYTGNTRPEYNIEMINVVGKSVAVAYNQLKRLGLNVVVSGSVNTPTSTEAIVNKQSVEAGTFLTKGNVVEIIAYYEGQNA
ncbi:MAG: PASTA domain-containing protein [Clostridia bacterium]|nr:PASTA domain-containing protein [Clostridia bacterium]